jgi:hypothetical protein
MSNSATRKRIPEFVKRKKLQEKEFDCAIGFG